MKVLLTEKNSRTFRAFLTQQDIIELLELKYDIKRSGCGDKASSMFVGEEHEHDGKEYSHMIDDDKQCLVVRWDTVEERENECGLMERNG